MKRKNVFLLVMIVIFGLVGAYLTFYVGGAKKYDSKTKAYKIEFNEYSDSDGDTMYSPVYYFKVNGDEYVCESSGSASVTPKKSNNLVFYDKSNPKHCMTQYNKNIATTFGIVCFVLAAIMAILFIKLLKDNENEYIYKTVDNTKNDTKNNKVSEEDIKKAQIFIDNLIIIVYRVILGVIIFGLLLFIMFDTLIVKQTIKAKDFIETTATISEKKTDGDSKVFDNYIYTFEDKDGNKQEVELSFSKDSTPDDKINIKYNEKDPQDFYEESATFDKGQIIGYIFKIVVLIVLIILFLSKRFLRKLSISVRR